MSELLPCPFCGGPAAFERTGSPRHSCIVACQNCGARHESSDEDERSGSSWNERATPPQAQPASEPSEAQISAGAHVLSEWLDDDAPLHERRYRNPARDSFKAMLALTAAQPAQAGEPKSARDALKRGALVEAVKRAILFADCGSSEDWKDNTDLGEAAIQICDARNPPRCSYCHAGTSEPRFIAIPPADAQAPVIALLQRMLEAPGTQIPESWKAAIRPVLAGLLTAGDVQADTQAREPTLPVEIYGKLYEVPIAVQVHIVALEMKLAPQAPAQEAGEVERLVSDAMVEAAIAEMRRLAADQACDLTHFSIVAAGIRAALASTSEARCVCGEPLSEAARDLLAERDSWKPGNPRRMLVKAGALILTEIERLDSIGIKTTQQGDAA